ncbi:MAG TPA: hypothetical protein VEW25_05780 [Allosphingosinicella sp.]|nr:hypothetical protein [Allosphingosinicella sp.]
MLRYLAAGGSAILLIVAGFFIWRIQAQPEVSVPDAPAAETGEAEEGGEEPGAARRPARPPSAPERSKEERRFNRADRDNDGRVTREELLQPRQKAFQRLDTNRNGNLTFEEWAARSITKFGSADANRDGALNRQEYATTAPKARPRPKQQNCRC